MANTQDVKNLLNEQINRELASANVYLAMASYCYSQELSGFGDFFMAQSREEYNHAAKQFTFLHDVDGSFSPLNLQLPATNFGSVEEVMQAALQVEQTTSREINNLVDAALSSKDYATYTFLEWFVTEQVEEEATMKKLLRRVQMAGDNLAALLILDSQLGGDAQAETATAGK